MNTKIILTFIFLFLSPVVFSQVFECGTDSPDTTSLEQLPWFGNNQYLENFLDSIGYPGNASNPSARIADYTVVYRVPIKFWIYRQSNGTGGPTPVQIQQYIDNLNRFYQVDNFTTIAFYSICEITYINSDANYNISGDSETRQLIRDRKDPNAINVHVVNNLEDLLGVFWRARLIGVEGIVLDRSTYINSDFSATLSHEVGHYFELLHTHQNSDKGKCRKEAIDRNRNWPFFNFCFANLRSNRICEATGDCLKDTPADHDLSNNDACDYIQTGRRDPWDDRYELPPSGSSSPDPGNILSYNEDRSCRNHFSRLQIGVMLHSIVKGKQKHKRQYYKDNRTIFDYYEPDNSSAFARPIIIGEAQERTFHFQPYSIANYSGLNSAMKTG